MQPDRGRTRTAIKRKCQRPLGRIAHIVLRVRDVEHAGLRRSIFQFQQNRSRRRGVLDLLAAHFDGVLGQHHLFFWLLFVFFLVLLVVFLVSALVGLFRVALLRGLVSRLLRVRRRRLHRTPHQHRA